MLYPDEVLIHDGNAHEYAHRDPVVDGERKSRGLVPRNYEANPVGYLGKICPPFHAVDLPLIPRSEWSQRIKDMESAGSRISDVVLAANVPCLDQDGKGYCHTADTEVLTERGWVPFPDYDWTARLGTVNPLTHALEFQAPLERHVYEYDGPMVYSTNRRLDFGVTPDHQMYVRKWDEARRTLSDRYSFVRAADIGWYSGLLPAPSGQIGTELVEVEIPGDRRYDGDDFLAMLGLVVSDGFAANYQHSGDLVSFASFRPERREAVAALAARLGFREQPSRPGVWNRWGAGALVAWLRENAYEGGRLGARAKRVPALVKWTSQRQIRHFLAWFDDRNRDGSQFYSASKGLVDDLQELHLRTGKRSTISTRPAKTTPFPGNKNGVIKGGDCFTLTVGAEDRLCLERKKHAANVPCLDQDGKGYCWAHSSAGALMALRALMNEPTVALSAYAVACVIKNYRDEGGWGALSLDFITSRGVPSEKFWPMKSMDRGNDKPETWANAALHKTVEAWVDLQAAQYDRNLTWDQVMTLLLSRVPVVVDYNWWGHSIYAADPVDGAQTWPESRAESGKRMSREEFDRVWRMNHDEPGAGYGVRIRNSWGASWGSQGFGVLAANKAVPDGSVAPRVTTPSVA
jgi:hypothetical protein